MSGARRLSVTGIGTRLDSLTRIGSVATGKCSSAAGHARSRSEWASGFLRSPCSAVGLVVGHDRQVGGARGDVGERVEVLEGLGERGWVLDGAGVLELLQLVEEDLGVLEVGRVLDAGRAAEREPDAFDAVAQGAAV